ncbi:transcription factor ABORTED MICROSPORES-like [Rosa rugosa]|uniref:transcription factor ABORTED MICROSPORES-like n=1 Tax=Rosa rugosa TaxID=74645 RepID=UPI002B4058AD|nr:transcription factor ABORTED MICROSPORES-like [Rosa rugosa]
MVGFRFIEWIGCCCYGIGEDTHNGGQELLFPVYQVFQCRDAMQLSRTNSFDILGHLPSSMPLDSGIYAKTLMSNQSCWLNCSSSNRDSSAMLVSEDQHVIDFITAQCNIWCEQDTLVQATHVVQTPLYFPHQWHHWILMMRICHTISQ